MCSINSDEAKKLPFYQSLSPSHMRLGTYQGKQYALPFSAESSMLLYNKTLFKRAGLNPDEPPKTWAELEAEAQQDVMQALQRVEQRPSPDAGLTTRFAFSERSERCGS